MLLGDVNWIEVMISLPVLLFSFSLHEFAHSFTAYALGDVTQLKEGRLTLSPFKHIDWMGFFCLLLFRFGWGKPVMVDFRYFAKDKDEAEDKDKEKDKDGDNKVLIKKGMKSGMALSSFAGPMSNFVLGFISILIYYPLYMAYYGDKAAIYSGFNDILYGAGNTVPMVVRFVLLLLFEAVQLNIVFGVFNMLPLPPLDGSKVFSAFLPDKTYFRFISGGGITTFIFLALIITGAISQILGPVATIIYRTYHLLAQTLYSFL